MQISNLVEKYKTMYLKEIKIFKHSFHIFLNLINIPNVYVHVNVLYWCPYGCCWLTVAKLFWSPLSICYQRQSAKLRKRKTTDKFIKRVPDNFIKLRRTFPVKIFCNLTSSSSIIFCRLSQKKVQCWYFLAVMVG